MELPKIITALITPFDSNLRLDLSAFSELIHGQVQAGVRALLIGGSTGEGLNLRSEEKRELLNIAKNQLNENARVLLILGISSPSLIDAVDQIKLAKQCQADCALITPPYYMGASERGMVQYYRELAELGLPFIVYHHPGRTGVFLELETLKEICRIEGVCAVKESSGDLDYSESLAKSVTCPVYCGNDELILESMRRGLYGSISVISNALAEMVLKVVEAASMGNFLDAQAAFDRLLPIIDVLSTEVNPVAIKALMQELGQALDFVRLPLIKMPYNKREKLRQVLKEANLDKLFETLDFDTFRT